jgi:hypothetical protein
MRVLISLAAALIVSVFVIASSGANVALASFHCMRIHAVMGGFVGNPNVQYVELRMNTGGQGLVSGHTLEFRDAAGTLKATFTFPSNVTNAATGESILIATSEFNSAASGGTADFTFSGANTVGANGGDPLHPVQGANGSVTWVAVGSPGASSNCALQGPPVDQVAYGTATATYGTAATTLPSPGTAQALRLNNLAFMVTNNSTEYSLQNVATATAMVTAPNLSTDFTTPRNNSRAVIRLNTPTTPSVGGIAEPPDLGSVATGSAESADSGMNYARYAGVGAAIAFLTLCGAGWYAYRRRAAQRA